MSAVFSGLGAIMLFLGVAFWLGDEWIWILDFLFQIVAFYWLARILFLPLCLFAVASNSARVLRFGVAFMTSVFIRWMIMLCFHVKVGQSFPIVESWYGIPYTLFCAWLVYLALSRMSFMRKLEKTFLG